MNESSGAFAENSYKGGSPVFLFFYLIMSTWKDVKNLISSFVPGFSIVENIIDYTVSDKDKKQEVDKQITEIKEYVVSEIAEIITGDKNANPNQIKQILNKANENNNKIFKNSLEAQLKSLQQEMTGKIERLSRQNQLEEFCQQVKLRELEAEKTRLHENSRENIKALEVLEQERKNEAITQLNVSNILSKDWLVKILWFLLIVWAGCHAIVIIIEGAFTASSLLTERTGTSFDKIHQQFLFLVKETTGKTDEMVRMFLSYIFGFGSRNFDELSKKIKLNSQKNQ